MAEATGCATTKEFAMNALILYRIGHDCHRRRIPILPGLMRNLSFLLFHAYVPSTASIGRGTVLGYKGMGVVIHAQAQIGDRCLIGQGVTIGSSAPYVSRQPQPCPRIGNDCYIAAGAKILGDIRIGDRCVVGANAVVLTDVPDGTIVAGVPAKPIGTTAADYTALRD